MLIDTHAHIYLKDFESDLEEMLARAKEAGVEHIVMPAIDVPSIHEALGLAERHGGLHVMAALHPSETRDATDADFDAIEALCGERNVVAVGETGLDYYWDRSFDHRQRDFLRRHIALAVESNLPIVFHNREAFDDLIRIVEEERQRLPNGERLRGIFHCFTGTWEEAERVSAAGFLVGIGGIVTFKNAELDVQVRDIPIERVVLETDAPYLAPAPHRGKRNEPAYVRFIAEKVAAVKEIPVRAVEQVTTEGAARLFNLDV